MDFTLACLVVLLMFLVVALFIFAYMMDRVYGPLLVACLAVMLWGSQPVQAQTINSTITVNGVTYHTKSTVDAHGNINSTTMQEDKMYKMLDSRCRGGSGDDPKTQVYCDMRDTLAN